MKARIGTANDLQLLQEWKDQMEKDVNTLNQAMTIIEAPEGTGDGNGMNDHDAGVRVIPLSERNRDTRMIEEHTVEASELALTSIDPSMLKDDQYRAYDIITNHLKETLGGSKPPPLRLVIHGEGGTGKSKVIKTITQFFLCKGVGYMLLKSVYTGIAASLIEGKTTHSIAMISQGKATNTLSDKRKCKLQNFWKNYTYLVIDEMSMISKSFLALISHVICIAKGTDGTAGRAESFGGINVILCGDFHQFPPVAASSNDALYFPSDANRGSVDRLLGWQIYEEFTMVVILKQQMRCTDPEWLDFLQHLQYGRVQERHINMLRGLVLRNPDTPLTDFTSTPWQDAVLVTPRHKVRIRWNELAVRKHCQMTGHQLFICYSEDTIQGRPLTRREKEALATRSMNKKSRQELPATVELAIGMKVMVTTNVETDLDITNGARGTIVDIILHPDESYSEQE